MKKIISIALSFAMLISLIPTLSFAEEEAMFTDIGNNTYYTTAVESLAKIGLINGYEDGTYKPENTITRAEMATIVCRMMNTETVDGDSAFADVRNDHWAKTYINAVTKKGIVNGDGNGNFRPNDDVKHEEALKMVVCALGFANDIKADSSDWSKPYLELAKSNGISDNLKGEKGIAASRADVAVMVYNGLMCNVVAPTASLSAGSYRGTQSVTLSTTTPDADIYYTTNGTTPTVKSAKYTKAISVSSTSTLKAVTILYGVLVSDVAEFDYTITRSSGGNSTTKYTVSFDLNYDGAGKPDTQSVKKGETASEPQEPSKSGYLFTGWYTDKNCTVAYDFEEAVNKNLTLYAGWIESEAVDSDEAMVQRACSSLRIEYSAGDYADSVIKNLLLATEIDGVSVSWSSSDTSVVKSDGTVIRPLYNDKSITLTASLTKGAAKATKEFNIVVMKNTSETEIKDNSVEDLTEMNEISEDFYIEYNADKTQIEAISGVFSDITVRTSEDALNSVCSVKSLLGMDNPKEELEVAVVNHTKYGLGYTFEQKYNGMDVYGRKVTVSADAEGKTSSVTSGFLASAKLNGKNFTPAISSSEAEDIAQNSAGGSSKAVSKDLVIYSIGEKYENNPVCAYIVEASGEDKSGNYIDETYIINALDGSIISSGSNYENFTLTGSGENELGQTVTFPVCYLKNEDKKPYCMFDENRDILNYKNNGLIYSDTSKNRYIIISDNNIWKDSAAISAYTNIITVYDWYKKQFDRISVDNNGLGLSIITNAPSMAYLNNAAWLGASNTDFEEIRGYFAFGRKYRTTKPTLGACLDVAAHEYTHGVTEYMTGKAFSHNHSNGHYTYAISEAYSDIFAWFVDNDDYTIGEDSEVLRNLKDPSKTKNPSKMYDKYWYSIKLSETFTLGKDSFAHTNSTVLSHAAYLMSKGFPAVGLPAIPNDKLFGLWYESLTKGYNALSNFETVRRNVLLAAGSIGLSQEEKQTITRAFNEVGITNDIGILNINVKNSENNSPISGVTVSLYYDNKLTEQWVTDSNGLARSWLNAGVTYHIVFEGTNYFTQEINVFVSPGNTTDVEIELRPKPKHGLGIASGSIRNENGAGIEGLSLKVIDDDGNIYHYSTTSNGGAYKTPELEPGEYRIEITDNRSGINESERYPTAYFNIEVVAGEEKRGQDYTMISTIDIVGTITDTNGNAIENAALTVNYDNAVGERVYSDSNGRYEFSNIPWQRFISVKAEREGYKTQTVVADAEDIKEVHGSLKLDIELEKDSVDNDPFNNLPEGSQKHSIIFAEGYRNGRMEMVLFDLKEKPDYVVWDSSLELSKGQNYLNYVKYYYDIAKDEWLYLEKDMHRISDKATEVYRSTLDVYKDGKLYLEGSSSESGKPEEEPPIGEIVASGKCCDTVNWELGEYGTLVISGTGRMTYQIRDNGSDAPWYEYRDNIKRLIIREGITDINGFMYLHNLLQVKISDSVNNIQKNCFNGCTSMEEIILPENITEIGEYAFCYTPSLKRVYWNAKAVKDVGRLYNGDYFEGTPFERAGSSDGFNVIFGDNVESLPTQAFRGSWNLVSVIIPSNVSSIGNGVFEDCTNLKNVTLGSSMGLRMFAGCTAIERIEIPATIRYIPEMVFYGCSSLKEISLLNADLYSINERAFYNTSLTDVYYSGDENNRKEIYIKKYNEPIQNAEWHYNN